MASNSFRHTHICCAPSNKWIGKAMRMFLLTEPGQDEGTAGQINRQDQSFSAYIQRYASYDDRLLTKRVAHETLAE